MKKRDRFDKNEGNHLPFFRIKRQKLPIIKKQTSIYTVSLVGSPDNDWTRTTATFIRQMGTLL
jgi:hypothetical protein